MFPHLSGWRVNLAHVQEAAVKDLLRILDQCEGTKAIIWDESLAGPVGLIAKYAFLKEHNVTKMFMLREGELPNVDVKNIIFITRPSLLLMNHVAENIYSDERKRKVTASTAANRKDFHLFFVPRRSLLCEKHLQMKGVFGSLVNVGEFRCDFFPVDKDLLSMEINDVYRDLHIDGDPTCIHHAALALCSFQKLFGRIPKVYGKGTYAHKVWQLMREMGRDEQQPTGTGATVDQLIIIDRSIDIMSVLATQLTYEGLIDELFSISCTNVQLPGDKFARNDEQMPGLSTADTKQVILNSAVPLYAELRDKNFNAVGQILARHAKSIGTQLDERHGDKSVQEIKKFVERIPCMLASKQSVATHTTIAEMIKAHADCPEFLDELDAEQEFMVCADVDRPSAYIEELIAKHSPLRTVLRLICMQCVAGSGLKPKVLDYYKRELVQVYGIETLITISNLERAGLLRGQTGARTYAVLRKTLNLTVEEVAEVAPKDISYVHSFYAPLSIRIVEQMLRPGGWQSLADVLACLPGPAFEEFQTTATGIGARRGSMSSEFSQSDMPRVILVFFLGGCTFAEVSALRFLAQQEDNNVEFVIATTKLVNKNSFLDSFIEEVRAPK